MTVAVVPAQAPARRSSARMRHGLMAGASLLLHAAVLSPMILLAAGDDQTLPLRPEPPIIQLQIEPAHLPPVQRPTLPEPTPLQAQPEARPLPVPAPQPAPPPPLPQPASISLPTPSPTPSAVRAPAPVPAPVAVPVPITAPPAAAERASETPAPEVPIRTRKKDEDETREGTPAAPSPPAPRIAAPALGAPSAAASGVPGVSDAWRFAPEGQSDRNARALRTSPAGCRSTGTLTRAEQLICDERFNARAAEGAARGAIVGSGNAERDARFAREGAREMHRYEAKRRPLSGGVGVAGPADCPGSNFGTGCAGAHLDSSLQMDSTRNIQTRREGPAASGRPITPGAAAPREPQ